MKEEYRRSCGMDVHKETIVVCVLPPVGGEERWFARSMAPFTTI